MFRISDSVVVAQRMIDLCQKLCRMVCLVGLKVDADM